MIHLRQLGPAFIRHVEAYGQLAAAAGRDLRTIAIRRALLGAIGVVLAISLVVLLGATLIAAGWETPYRAWVAAGVLVLLALAALACLAAARAPIPDSTHVQALRDEWQKDRAWLASRERGAVTAERTTAVAAPPGGGTRHAMAAQESRATSMHGT